MSQVDDFQEAQEAIAQMKEERERAAREREADRLRAQLSAPPLRATAARERYPELIALKLIQPIENIRTTLPDIEELAMSIKEQGLISPLEVREVDDEERPYQVFAGRRRYEALRLLDPSGESAVRCEVVEGLDDDAEAYALMFSENAQRKDFTPREYAHGFRLLLDKNPEWTAAELARSLGGDITARMVRQHLRLLDLPPAVQSLVDDGSLTFTFADLLRKGHQEGKLSAEEAVELAEQRAAGEVKTSEVREQVFPKGKGYVPEAPENYEETSAELDAARWGKQDRSSSGFAGAELNDEFDESDAEVGDIKDAPNLPVRAPEPAGWTGDQSEEALVRHRTILGTRQLEAYLLAEAALELAPEEFLAELGVHDDDVYRYVWELSEEDRRAFGHRVAEAMVRSCEHSALPEAIFPAGA